MVDDSLLPAHSCLLTHLGFAVLSPRLPILQLLICPVASCPLLHSAFSLLSFIEVRLSVFSYFSVFLPAGDIRGEARCRERDTREEKAGEETRSWFVLALRTSLRLVMELCWFLSNLNS